MSDLLLAYYGDDFTGSTDVMESLTLGGVPTVLFLDTPEPDFIHEQFPHVRAIGLAGITRSMSPAQMSAELPAKFAMLRALDAPVFHYKVCSTFDSSPEIGSIGHAIDLAWDYFNPTYVPLVVGTPSLKRYVVFGNLFATVAETTYRIDRHPTMSKHPITPMHESDLRLHLGAQTSRKIGLIDVLKLDVGEVEPTIYALLNDGNQIILFDTLTLDHLVLIGESMWEGAKQANAFVVGSSGVENALTAHWQHAQIVQPPAPIQPPPPVSQLVVMSGSASPVTAAQMKWAFAHGFEGIRLDVAALINPDDCAAAHSADVESALEVLSAGKSVLLYSAFGPDDPALAETKAAAERVGLETEQARVSLAIQQGVILKNILERTGLKRACVAGGDTSGYVASQLGIYALQMRMPIAPGAPLCSAYSNNPQLQNLEISLKGGQNGDVDYFGSIQRGHA